MFSSDQVASEVAMRYNAFNTDFTLSKLKASQSSLRMRMIYACNEMLQQMNHEYAEVVMKLDGSVVVEGAYTLPRKTFKNIIDLFATLSKMLNNRRT